jgi:hypothetical protein
MVLAQFGIVTTPPPRCRIAYDQGWRPELAAAMQSDPSPHAVQRGLEQLAEVLANLVDRPDEVTLVAPVGLAEAVVRRQPDTGYHTDRGTGMVAARTMEFADGRIEVIVETGFLADVDDTGQSRFTPAGVPRLSQRGLQALRRTIVHEAQHALMIQRDSGYEQYALQTHAVDFPRWDYAVSAKMCDEHRAEWNAVQLTSPERPSRNDILDVLSHLGTELTAANARYQASSLVPSDIYQLMESVYNACAAFWTSMTYWAAQFRDGDHLGAMDTEITSLELWKRYVGPTWDSLGEALSRLPVADLTTPATVLQQSARGLATWVAESLQFIGFRHIVMPPSDEAFYDDRADFPSQRG